jgi:hypothetical protein
MLTPRHCALKQTLTSLTKRISVFETLSKGKTISENRTLPYILKNQDRDIKNKKESVSTENNDSQSERCWKALLLHPTSFQELNEWEIVREHFENSRSKKVLSIIQQ